MVSTRRQTYLNTLAAEADRCQLLAYNLNFDPKYKDEPMWCFHEEIGLFHYYLTVEDNHKNYMNIGKGLIEMLAPYQEFNTLVDLLRKL
jgi:hypothetical protein